MTSLAIDCHGHFTTEPPEFRAFRDAEVAYAEGRSAQRPAYAGIDDDILREIISQNQLRVQQQRGTDLTILSPRTSGMGHHVPVQHVATAWARLSNDTVRRRCELFPRNFAPVCQLPQTIDGNLGPVVAEHLDAATQELADGRDQRGDLWRHQRRGRLHQLPSRDLRRCCRRTASPATAAGTDPAVGPRLPGRGLPRGLGSDVRRRSR
jgi:hypothetical protein